MFHQIPVELLKPFERYKIAGGKCEYYGTFIGVFYFPHDHVEYAEFVRVFNKTTCVHVDSKLFSPSCMFYRFISQKAKIQSQMEKRALNLIIRKIIGDENFMW